jgi:S1-C subfamily serine protease
MKAAIHIALAALVIVASLVGLATATPAMAQAADFPITDGHFYTQTSSVAGLGYRITDEDGAPFWAAFQAYGGVDALGYPMSRRFVLDGFTSQATQRAILQWNPATGRVNLVNILDRLHDAGFDAQLASCCATPSPLPPDFDAGKSWDRVVADRQSILDVQPLLRAAYFAVPNPLDRYGLPTSNVTDMGDHFSVRAQRTVLQLWKTDVPWARAGQVTIANSGDLARVGNLIPITAIAPEQPAGGLDAPGQLTPEQSAALDAAANAVRAATVQVIVPPSTSGTGFIISGDGLVLTANHVVEDGRVFGVILPDGRRFATQLIGRDRFFDVALLRIVDGSDLPVAALGSSGVVARGDPVVALGYGGRTAHDLGINPGRVVALGTTRRPGETARTSFLVTDVGLIPGFSGGPLVEAQGRVIGINTAVVTSRRGSFLPGHSLAIAIDAAMPALRQLAAGLQPPAGALGVSAADLTEELAAEYGVGLSGGALIVRVAPGSAAEEAALRPGEVVVWANGRAVDGSHDLASALEDRGVETHTLTIVGHDGRTRTAEVSLGRA